MYCISSNLYVDLPGFHNPSIITGDEYRPDLLLKTKDDCLYILELTVGYEIKTRRHNHRCIFIYKCINGLIDFGFDLTKNVSIHDHNTRRSNDLHLPRVNSNKGKQKPTYQASIDFNNLDQRTKSACTLQSFKAYLKRTSN